ncbi:MULTISPECIES: dTDP-glucose pyrophosphorylase [Leuconostoc]|uniref:Prophage Lp2 protein 24 n=1 Tax=Leuconostoc kimchii (strain IMSNU 11154 / KCTC 2386 / IH25) TaxID=762051 RepID=D5T0X4_LEUKI|nr:MULTISPECIES: dTDP-glucose pyrophosphorylase [Leuconostoc]ADG39923.1 prophage Lp2 protein 24 [Leuconostoc kimchii IMSNU 11154]MBZ5971615.1 dTDP-glucose pyrophosphorylase [Leuconostoc gasicomitatum]
MEKVTLGLTVLKPLTLNKYIEAERKNKFIAAKLKKQGTLYARSIFLQAMVDGVAFNWPCKLKFDWYLPDKRIDPDNWAFTQKFIFDGMQKAITHRRPFLDNDNFKNINGFDHDFYIDKAEPRVEIYEIEART